MRLGETSYKMDNQKRCESFDSIDISYYLYKKIKDAKEKEYIQCINYESLYTDGQKIIY